MSTQGYTSDLHKEIKIEMNDPSTDLVVLTMKARVFEALRISPRTLNFGKLLQGQAGLREIVVRNMGKKAVKVTKVEVSPRDRLQLSPEEPFALKPGEEKKMTVKLDSGSKDGYVRGFVSFQTDLEYVPVKTVQVFAEVKENQSPQ